MTIDSKTIDALEKIFHEPNRLAIMSALCAADDGLVFGELKTQCRLTDGNLSRHLKVLEEAGAIRVSKAFVDAKPRTTVYLSDDGLHRFEQYLTALGDVLEKARASMPITERKETSVPFGQTAES